MNLAHAFMKAYTDHTDVCAIAIDNLDSAVMGRCPYCGELQARASAAMNHFLDSHPPILDQVAWNKRVASHAAYRANNPRAIDDDIELYTTAPPLPEGVTVDDLPVPKLRTRS